MQINLQWPRATSPGGARVAAILAPVRVPRQQFPRGPTLLPHLTYLTGSVNNGFAPGTLPTPAWKIASSKPREIRDARSSSGM